MLDPVMFNSLRRFRAGVYGAFGARRDALFDLLDAATVAGLVPSLAYLSLTAPRVGQPVRCPGGRDAGCVGVTGVGGAVAPGRWAADLRVGYERLAARRC
jgi:hypothetical protein